jgi:hypothetical protein
LIGTIEFKVVWNPSRVQDEFLEMTFRLGKLWAFLDDDETVENSEDPLAVSSFQIARKCL